ncbi:MAG: hypothetical protein Q8S00_04335 [Deltaproteobacteria bacterium]|nr:hypothetical protein [Deltaproteobacteria bacterium]
MVKAITDGTFIVPLLEVNGNSQVAFFKLNFASIINNGAITVAAQFVFRGAKFGSFYLGLCHGPHGGKRHRLTLFTAARAEDGIFLTSFNDRIAVRRHNFLYLKCGSFNRSSSASATRRE